MIAARRGPYPGFPVLVSQRCRGPYRPAIRCLLPGDVPATRVSSTGKKFRGQFSRARQPAEAIRQRCSGVAAALRRSISASWDPPSAQCPTRSSKVMASYNARPPNTGCGTASDEVIRPTMNLSASRSGCGTSAVAARDRSQPQWHHRGEPCLRSLTAPHPQVPPGAPVGPDRLGTPHFVQILTQAGWADAAEAELRTLSHRDPTQPNPPVPARYPRGAGVEVLFSGTRKSRQLGQRVPSPHPGRECDRCAGYGFHELTDVRGAVAQGYPVQQRVGRLVRLVLDPQRKALERHPASSPAASRAARS